MQDFYRISRVLYRWIRLKQTGESIENLLIKRGFYNIVIYGFTDIAKCLIYDLVHSEVTIRYMIDKKGSNVHIDFPTYTLSEIESEGIDAVICCYLGDDDIIYEIKKYFTCEVISVEELIYEV
jgi:hypothetical protein